MRIGDTIGVVPMVAVVVAVVTGGDSSGGDYSTKHRERKPQPFAPLANTRLRVEEAGLAKRTKTSVKLSVARTLAKHFDV
ncbi:hypothetical protein O3P69_006618 [Scylla paramamosain]|uniref:Secreted protein n=1 Tax=Scylla paramamosain TaxID=85552 RepID=A0AAW0U3L1_SCYPA